MAKMRSPNYPAVSLTEAIQRVRALWTKEKRTAVPADVAAKAIGYSGLSGPSRSTLGAMKKYGLVDSDDKTVCVSDLALRILHPANEGEQLQATQQAALLPELFASLHGSYAQASDDALRSYLITKLDFSESGARQVIKTFRETISLAKLDNSEYIPPRGGAMEDKSNMNQATDSSRFTSKQGAIPGKTPLMDGVYPNVPPNAKPEKTWRWPLSDEVDAEVRITGGEVRPEYFDALRKYLDLARGFVTTFQVGDTVEFEDAYTHEIKWGRITQMFGGTSLVSTITKEEAGPNPKRFSPKPDARIAAITDGTGIIKN
jgi:hypothetical protein